MPCDNTKVPHCDCTCGGSKQSDVPMGFLDLHEERAMGRSMMREAAPYPGSYGSIRARFEKLYPKSDYFQRGA